MSTGNGRRGQALAEFALILPVFMLVMLIAVDFGRLFFTYIEVTNAAREGAAYGAGDPTGTTAITARAQKETNAQSQRGENTISVSATCADPSRNALACANAPGGSGTGNTITVAVSENFSFLSPLINGVFGNNFKVGASANAAVIKLAAGGTGSPACTTAPTASFTITPSNLTVNLDASASTPNSGLCAISGYNWDMADTANPDPFPPIVGETASYTYTVGKTYTVTLEVTNQAGSATTTRDVTVPAGNACQAPTAFLQVTPTTGSKKNHGGQQGTTFTFDGSSSTNMSTSSCNPTWTVDFGDGTTPASGTGVPPTNTTHKYADSVTSPVYATLKVTNTMGSNTSSQVKITLT